MKRYEIEHCGVCGGNRHVDPETHKRVPIYQAPNPCTCPNEDSSKAAARIASDGSKGK